MPSNKLSKDQEIIFHGVKASFRYSNKSDKTDADRITETDVGEIDRDFIEGASRSQRASTAFRKLSDKPSDKGWSIRRLYPLAQCRGKVKTCDVCGLPAKRQCARCQVTCYCSVEHQLADPFHGQICDRLSVAYKERPFDLITEVRELGKRKVKVLKEELVQHITFLGEKSMYMENYESAVLSFQQLIRFSTDVFGAHSEHVLMAYIYLTEALVNTGAFAQAKSTLGKAIVIFDVLCQKCQFIDNRNNSSSVAHAHPEDESEAMMQNTKIALLNVESMVSSAFGEYDNALFYMADSIYYLADMRDVDDMRLAASLHSMGNIFQLQGSVEIAETFYTHSLDIYIKRLTYFVSQTLKQQEGVEDNYLVEKKIESKLSMMTEGEAKVKLWKMYAATKPLDRLSLDFAKACTGLSSVYYLASKYKSAKLLAKRALNKKQILECPLVYDLATTLFTRSESEFRKETKKISFFPTSFASSVKRN